MTEDTWSLKGKEHIGWIRVNEMRDFSYRNVDIETLRQKLIEDVEEIFPKWIKERVFHGNAIGEMKDRINKRFGVE